MNEVPEAELKALRRVADAAYLMDDSKIEGTDVAIAQREMTEALDDLQPFWKV